MSHGSSNGLCKLRIGINKERIRDPGDASFEPVQGNVARGEDDGEEREGGQRHAALHTVSRATAEAVLVVYLYIGRVTLYTYVIYLCQYMSRQLDESIIRKLKTNQTEQKIYPHFVSRRLSCCIKKGSL